MKVLLKVNENLTVEVAGDSLFDLFNELSSAQQVFSVSECGCCKSKNLKFVVRKASSGKKDFNYPEVWCTDCRARLSYGQSEGGVLYPKIKWSQLLSDSDKEQWAEAKDYADKHAGYLPNGGWYKYVKKD